MASNAAAHDVQDDDKCSDQADGDERNRVYPPWRTAGRLSAGLHASLVAGVRFHGGERTRYRRACTCLPTSRKLRGPDERDPPGNRRE